MEANKLPYDDHMWLIMGLTLGSVEAFTKPFKLVLNLARVDNMGMEVSLSDESAPLLKEMKEIAKKAISLWSVMNTSDTWNELQPPTLKRVHWTKSTYIHLRYWLCTHSHSAVWGYQTLGGIPRCLNGSQLHWMTAHQELVTMSRAYIELMGNIWALMEDDCQMTLRCTMYLTFICRF